MGTLLTAAALLASQLYANVTSLLLGCGVGGSFCSDACERVHRALSERIVGQQLALTQVVAAVCDHLQNEARAALLRIRSAFT